VNTTSTTSPGTIPGTSLDDRHLPTEDSMIDVWVAMIRKGVPPEMIARDIECWCGA
jgi:hypothetical protein